MAKGQKKQAQVKINKSQFEGLCQISCTEPEIAYFFNVSHDTVNRWCHETYGDCFANVYKRFTSFGNISIRRAQFKLAQHNVTMAIWLGKQLLGQRDFIETNTAEVEDDPLTKSIKESIDNAKRKAK